MSAGKPIASTPANWILRFETTGRAPNFGFTGTSQPVDANYAIDLIIPYYPTLAINTLRITYSGSPGEPDGCAIVRTNLFSRKSYCAME